MQFLGKIGAFVIIGAAVYAQSPAGDDAPAPIESDQKAIWNHIAENALKYGKSLPDFVCDKITRHNVDLTGFGQSWKLNGTLDEELTYAGHKESYEPTGGNGKKFTDTRKDEPSLEFGGIFAAIFDPKARTEHSWHSWNTVNHRRMYVFAVTVAAANSQFTIGFKTPKAVGFGGMLWADPETNMVTHISLLAQSPPNFSLTGVTYEVIYDFAKIADQTYVVPMKSDFRGKEGKTLVWNEIEFKRYRKPGADPDRQLKPRPPEQR